jgi:hypothetical protein
MKILLFWLGSLSSLFTDDLSLMPAVEKPVIDGRIEAVWESGRLFSDFVQYEPNVFAPASVKTDVFFLYDSNNLYLAARLVQTSHTIKASQGKRDAGIVQDGDHVIFLLDPLRNGNFAYYFVVNPANAVADGILDASGTWDPKWDGIFDRQTAVSDSEWTVEIKIPLSTIQFQQAQRQDWGFLVVRRFAQRQETSLSRLEDKNEPYRISRFDLLHGLEGIHKTRPLMVTPYLYSSRENDNIRHRSPTILKSGGELKFRPFSSMTILATVNPDYAQLETDNDVINVSDLPTEYPEKRPFFTESSDLYQCLAVNTRNISDIDFGLKTRQVVGNLKYDATWVRAKDRSDWAMADIRYTDNARYLFELVTGTRHDTGRTDYNITTNVRTWFFDKRLTIYTWFGTINRPGFEHNQYESVNSVKWITRELQAGVWNHVKAKYYNPNIVGFHTLSNEVILDSWAKYTFYRADGLLRKWTIGYQNSIRDLHTDPGHRFHILQVLNGVSLHPTEAIGTIDVEFTWLPPTKQYFRYRDASHFGERPVYQDAISSFVLAADRRNTMMTSLKSDFSKRIGLRIDYDNKPVRAASTHNVQSESYVKITPKWLVGYSLGWIRIGRSAYQAKYRQSIHRWKVEYNFTDRLNIRAVAQSNRAETPLDDGLIQEAPLLNLTLSWEYGPGSYLYVVLNQFAQTEDRQTTPRETVADRQAIALKINRTFTF